MRRAGERQPAAITDWLESDYRGIAARAKCEKAVIYQGDETGISNQDRIGRSWAPRGQPSVITRDARRFGESMISAVRNRGLMRFMLYDGALNIERFLTFLRRLIKDAGQKVFSIVDDLRARHTKKVDAWAAAHAHEFELLYLPASAPDHDPDDHLNNDRKQQSSRKPQPPSPDTLKSTVRSVMRSIQRAPERVVGDFQPETVGYAACSVRRVVAIVVVAIGHPFGHQRSAGLRPISGRDAVRRPLRGDHPCSDGSSRLWWSSESQQLDMIDAARGWRADGDELAGESDGELEVDRAAARS